MISRWTLMHTGVQLPLVDALRASVLLYGLPYADEPPVQMLASGEKKTQRAYALS